MTKYLLDFHDGKTRIEMNPEVVAKFVTMMLANSPGDWKLTIEKITETEDRC